MMIQAMETRAMIQMIVKVQDEKERKKKILGGIFKNLRYSNFFELHFLNFLLNRFGFGSGFSLPFLINP